MDKTNLKSIIAVNEDLMLIADKLKEVAETLDAIVGSEEKLAREEAKKKAIAKKPVKKPVAKAKPVEVKPKAKRGRPAKKV